MIIDQCPGETSNFRSVELVQLVGLFGAASLELGRIGAMTSNIHSPGLELASQSFGSGEPGMFPALDIAAIGPRMRAFGCSAARSRMFQAMN